MSAWAVNVVALLVACVALGLFALGLLWRLGSWHLAPAASLIVDHGLELGSVAPELAAHSGDDDVHMSFGGRPTFVAFGNAGCEPCTELLHAAALHPATRYMRLVYVSDSEVVGSDPDVIGRWEIYRYHDEAATLRKWRAPVAPYFYVVSVDGRVAAKGIANHADHLDRLMSLRPDGGTGDLVRERVHAEA